MTDAEWQSCLEELGSHGRLIASWDSDIPNPTALRCEQLLHPWRLFDQNGYANRAWEEHMTAFTADRSALLEVLRRADRTIGGKVNASEYTIEGLIAGRILAHERHHLFSNG